PLRAASESTRRPLTRQRPWDCMTDSSACAVYDRNLVVESHLNVFTLIKTCRRWRGILSTGENSEQCNFDGERFLDIAAKLIAQFFQPPDLAQNVRPRKALREGGGFFSRVGQIPEIAT